MGSTKVEVMKWAREYLPDGISFIGGHPMAGKETSGIDSAEPDLYKGCIYCLTPAAGADENAVHVMKGLVTGVGATPVLIDPAVHDHLVAGISHLPMIISAACVTGTVSSPSWPEMSRLAAGGYKDVSRLASGNPEMNRDIFLTNQAEIVNWLDLYIEELKRLRRMIMGNSEELVRALDYARSERDKWLRGGGR
jgi:prephenate dehydrogenase